MLMVFTMLSIPAIGCMQVLYECCSACVHSTEPGPTKRVTESAELSLIKEGELNQRNLWIQTCLKFCHGKSCKLMLSHEIVNNIRI